MCPEPTPNPDSQSSVYVISPEKDTTKPYSAWEQYKYPDEEYGFEFNCDADPSTLEKYVFGAVLTYLTNPKVRQHHLSMIPDRLGPNSTPQKAWEEELAIKNATSLWKEKAVLQAAFMAKSAVAHFLPNSHRTPSLSKNPDLEFSNSVKAEDPNSPTDQKKTNDEPFIYTFSSSKWLGHFSLFRVPFIVSIDFYTGKFSIQAPVPFLSKYDKDTLTFSPTSFGSKETPILGLPKAIELPIPTSNEQTSATLLTRCIRNAEQKKLILYTTNHFLFNLKKEVTKVTQKLKYQNWLNIQDKNDARYKSVDIDHYFHIQLPFENSKGITGDINLIFDLKYKFIREDEQTIKQAIVNQPGTVQCVVNPDLRGSLSMTHLQEYFKEASTFVNELLQ